MSQTAKNILKFVIFFSLGILLTVVIFRQFTPEQLDEMKRSFGQIQWQWLILSVIFATISHASRAKRWQLMIEPVHNKPKFSNTFYAVMVGYFVNLAAPRLGEPTRCGVMARYEGVPFDKVLGTVITDRLLDMMVYTCVFALVLLLEYDKFIEVFNTYIWSNVADKFRPENFLPIGIGILVFVVLVFLIRKFSKKWFSKLKSVGSNLKEGILSLRKVKNFPAVVFHTFFIWIMYFAMIYSCFFAMPETSSLGPSVGLMILFAGTIGVVITPGGIGSYPLIVASVLLLYGLEYTTGTVFGWVIWTTQTLLIIVLGLLSFLLLGLNNRNKNEEVQINPATAN